MISPKLVKIIYKMSWLQILLFLGFISCIIASLIIYSEKKYKKDLLVRGRKLLDSIPKDFKIEDEKFLSIPKYYLNLERSKDRREKIENKFKKYNISNYTRINAFDKKDIDDIKKGEINGVKYINEYEELKDFELAITLGHLKIIKKSYEKGEDLAIIFEDDIDFSLYPKWKKSFTEILKEIPSDMEIFQMSSNILYDQRKKCSYNILKRPNNSRQYGCAGAYLINRKGMKKIIDNFFRDENTIVFMKQGFLMTPCIDLGIFNYMNIYYIDCNLFLLYNFENKKNTSGQENLIGFIEKDYQTLKYLTDNN